jgi:hypothetical protein
MKFLAFSLFLRKFTFQYSKNQLKNYCLFQLLETNWETEINIVPAGSQQDALANAKLLHGAEIWEARRGERKEQDCVATGCDA